MMSTKIPFNISVEDYLSLKSLYAQFILKIGPLGKILDGETRKIIEEFNQIYVKLENELHDKIIIPSCFAPTCLQGVCTSDIEICKYVHVLSENPSAIRVLKKDVLEFKKNGWMFVSNDVRDNTFFGSSEYAIMIPESGEIGDGMQ